MTKEQAFAELLRLWESDAPAGVIGKFIRTHAGVQERGVPSDGDKGGGVGRSVAYDK